MIDTATDTPLMVTVTADDCAQLRDVGCPDVPEPPARGLIVTIMTATRDTYLTAARKMPGTPLATRLYSVLGETPPWPCGVVCAPDDRDCVCLRGTP